MAENLMEYDLVIVGGGPAGLSAAIRYAQLAIQEHFPVRVCVLEKGSEIGAHVISGAVFEPRALNELFPDWQTRGAPVQCPVTQDVFQLLTEHRAITLPTPPGLRNAGNYIISLSALCRWLAQQAEALGVDIFPGYAASRAVFDSEGTVIGIETNPVGIDKQGHHKPNYQPGMEVRARYTLLAEGCRGSLAKQLMEHFKLNANNQAQSYGIGIKELWEIDPVKHQAGKVLHTVGWPLKSRCYGGSFSLQMNPNLLSIGFIMGLDYQNPYLDPFEEFQKFKHHPSIKPLLLSGRRIEYGARAVNEGGFQSIPTLAFPGGLLVGCAAGFMNIAKLKGNHTAMKSGMLAAESVFEAMRVPPDQAPKVLSAYSQTLKASWLGQELKKARNIRPAFHFGLWFGLAYAALDTYVFRGRAPWTLGFKADYLQLKPAHNYQAISYPKPDGQISFDKASSLALSNIQHEPDQPPHLQLKDPSLAIKVNWQRYASPEQRYCPASVYNLVQDSEGKPVLKISAQNCLHCKTCDIKDPLQNITWVPPEGGGGPNYRAM